MRLFVGSLLLLAAACGGGGIEPTASPSAALGAIQGFEPGEQLPDATLPFIDREGALTTADLRGQPAVINFWASWCAFCVDEMPDFQAVHEELGDEVRFIGVDREDDHDKAMMLAEGTGVNYELVADDDGSFFRAVQARGMPTTLVVNAEGEIVARHTGPIDAEGLRELLADALPEAAGTRGRGR